MYESPIKIIKPIDFITQQITHQIDEAVDNQIYEAVLKVGIEVDKEELIKALRYDRGEYEQGFLAGRLSAQSDGEWISVEDRLPSKEDLERSQFHSFLVANEFGEVREAVFTGKYFAKLGSRLSGVTHWMPLPESPKMKGGEG